MTRITLNVLGGGEDTFLLKTLDGVCGKREAKAATELWRNEENNKARLEPSGSIDTTKTVAQYMDEYVEALRESESLEHSTIIGYGTSLGYIKGNMVDVPLVSLTSAHVQRFVNALNKQGYSPSTVRKAYMLLNQGMDQVVRDGYLSESPCKRKSVRLPKKKFTKPNALDERGRAHDWRRCFGNGRIASGMLGGRPAPIGRTRGSRARTHTW